VQPVALRQFATIVNVRNQEAPKMSN
jgi:hypothetical protein